MKRFLLHILFWAVYLLQDSIMEFTWVMRVPIKVSEAVRMGLSFETSCVVAIPKILFTYFVLYFIFPRVLKYSGLTQRIGLALLTFVTLALLILSHRIIKFYIVAPIIWRGNITPIPIFNIPYLLLTIMDFGFASGYAFTFKLLRMQLLGKEREKGLVQEKLQTELKFLRNQTHPHFLFNTLNNIYALARKKSERTAEMIMKLSKLLRFMLYESGKGLIAISEEIRILEDYLELQKIRFNERLRIQFHKDIDNEAECMAPLLLLPFVENAFKHGASETRFNSFIEIDLRLHQHLLSFTISNNKEEGQIKPEQIGLSNVRRQLELMYDTYDLQVTHGDDTFTVQLTINLQSHAKI